MSIIESFVEQVPNKTLNKYLKNAGRDPIRLPRKSYADYKFSEATKQKRQARQEKIAQ